MKKKIAILGSTGSIGVSTVSLIEKNIKDFNIELISTNKNIKLVEKQCKKLKPKYLVIKNYKSFLKFKKKINSKKLKFLMIIILPKKYSKKK